MYVYFCIYIYMEVYGWVVDTELEISAQVSGPIGLQVGKVQLDLVSWPFGLRCGQIAFSIQQKRWNDKHPWLFLEMIYFYEFYIVLRWIFPSKKVCLLEGSNRNTGYQHVFFFSAEHGYHGISNYYSISRPHIHIYHHISSIFDERWGLLLQTLKSHVRGELGWCASAETATTHHFRRVDPSFSRPKNAILVYKPVKTQPKVQKCLKL